MLPSEFGLFFLRLFAVMQRATTLEGSEKIFYESKGHKDFVIGALFPMHRKSPCVEVWPEYGIQRMEMAVKAIGEINRNNSILPGVTLGLEIRDSCWTEKVAVEQTIQMLRSLPGCSAAAAKTEKRRPRAPLVAVIGPGSSDNSKAVHNLLQIFSIPQIGYSATSVDLSDKDNYKYYMRVVPSDDWQAKAFVDIVKHFNWTYVGVFYSEGSYGQKGLDELNRLDKDDRGFCIGPKEIIKKGSRSVDIMNSLKKVVNDKKAPKTWICFCLGDDVRKIFQALKRVDGQNGRDKASFQIIGSESWGDRRDVVESYEEWATGSMSIRIHSPDKVDFDSHFLALGFNHTEDNPWWPTFWEQQFNCSRADGLGAPGRNKCDPKATLRSLGTFKQDSKLSQVVTAMYVIAFALDRMNHDKCGSRATSGLCPAMSKINGSELFYEYMLKVKFDMFDQLIGFDHNGDPVAKYDIINFQSQPDGSHSYRKIGEWTENNSGKANGTPQIWINTDVQFYNGRYLSESHESPSSTCSTPCAVGEVKLPGQLDCCWSCDKCNETQYIKNEVECGNCEKGQWATVNRSHCFDLPIEYLRFESIPALCAITFAIAGILATLLIASVFVRYNSTPVVKATTRELSYIILGGIFLCYSATFILVVKPTRATCYGTRLIPGTAFAMMYGALLTKTNRIARILAGSKKRILTKKPKFLSTTSQVVITCLIICFELGIITALLILQPADAVMDYTVHRRVLLICNTSKLAVLVPFGFDFLLISLCTLYAVKTRNLPENFNEAKFIGFTMYTTFVIWLGFVTIYFGSESKSITMSLSFSLSATVALVLLFMPKAYIILLHPERNVRSAYATTKVIRCHIGTSASQMSSCKLTRNAKSATDSERTSSERESVGDSVRIRPRAAKGSIHIQKPKDAPLPPAASSNPIDAPFDGTRISDNVYIANMKSVPSKSPFKSGPELSVIEESVPSRESTDPGNRKPSEAPQRRTMYTQTDSDYLEAFLRSWLQSNEDSSELRRRGPRPSTTELSLDQSDSSSPATAFKRTFSEYGRIALEKRTPRLRRPRNSECEKKLDPEHSSAASGQSNRVSMSTHSPDSSPLVSGPPSKASESDFALIDPQIAIIAEEPQKAGEDNPGFHSNQPRPSCDLIGETLGSSFTTFFGTAVGNRKSQNFYISSSYALSDEPLQVSPRPSSTGDYISPKSSQANIFTKLGYSIRSKIKKKSAGEVAPECEKLNSEPRPGEENLEATDPEENPENEGKINKLKLVSKESFDSDAADSGFLSSRPSEKMASFDSAQSSKHSSEKSKRSSGKTLPESSDPSFVLTVTAENPRRPSTIQELRDLIKSSGIEIELSSTSTVV